MTRKGIEGLDQIQWLDQWYGKGESVELETIGLSLPVDEIYEKITLPATDPLQKFRKRPKS